MLKSIHFRALPTPLPPLSDSSRPAENSRRRGSRRPKWRSRQSEAENRTIPNDGWYERGIAVFFPQQRKLRVFSHSKGPGAGRSSQNPTAQGSQIPRRGSQARLPSRVRKGSQEEVSRRKVPSKRFAGKVPKQGSGRGSQSQSFPRRGSQEGSQTRIAKVPFTKVPKSGFPSNVPKQGSQRFPRKASKVARNRFPKISTGSQAQVPQDSQRFSGTGYQEQVSKQGSQPRFAKILRKRFPVRGSQARFSGKVPKQGSQGRFPSRFPSKVRTGSQEKVPKKRFPGRFPSMVPKSRFQTKFQSKVSKQSSQARFATFPRKVLKQGSQKFPGNLFAKVPKSGFPNEVPNQGSQRF